MDENYPMLIIFQARHEPPADCTSFSFSLGPASVRKGDPIFDPMFSR